MNSKIQIKISSLIIFIVIIVGSFTFVDQLSEPLTNSSSLNIADTAKMPSDAKQLITFFNGLNDSYGVIGYQKYYLVTYSNKVVIDLSLGYGFNTFAHIFENKTLSQLIDDLSTKDIRYLIVPRGESNNEFLFINACRSLFSSFHELFRSDYLQLLTTLDNYKVYKILDASEYALYIEQLSALYYYQNEPYIVLNDNQATFYQSSTTEISLSDTTAYNVSGQNALAITLNPFDSNISESIKCIFSSNVNVAGKDFLSFYLYGNNLGTAIDIRFYTNDWKNQFNFTLWDSWVGYARVIIPLSDFKVLVGNPQWSNITSIAFFFGSKIDSRLVFYVDDVSFDSGLSEYYCILSSKIDVAVTP